jgi:hypothetical protein
MESLVNSQDTWSSAISRHKNKLENPSLVQQENIKDRKHAAVYAPLGFSFFAFVVSCLDLLGLLPSGVFSPLLILNYASTIPA